VSATVLVGAACRAALEPPKRSGSGSARRTYSTRTAVFAGVVVFVAIQFGIHSAVQSDATPLRDPIYAEKFDALRRHPEFFADTCDRPRLVAIGSSRTLLCLDATRLSGDHRAAFNCAAAGCGPVTNALYLKRLLTAGLKCETALVELHPAMLADHNPPFEAAWLHTYRLRPNEPDVLRSYGWAIDTPPQFQAGGELRAASVYRFSLLNAAHPKLLPSPFGLNLAGRMDARGHVPGVAVPPEDRPKFLAEARATYAGAFQHYRPGGPAVAAVRDTLTRLQAHGIQPVLLFTPESAAFRSWYGEAGDNAMSVLAAAMASEFRVPLIDARGWLADDELADGHHAMPNGAKTFTEKLAVVLKEMGR
jgi:hypothetical protein